MAQITDGGSDLPRRQGRELSAAKLRRTLIGCFAQEHPAKGGFAAGHRAGDANDIAGAGGQAQAGEDGLPAIGKGEVLQRDILCRRDVQRFQRFGLLHQRLDALPRDFRLLHGVEQLCHLGGLDHQLGETGQEGGEGCDVPCAPAGAQHVLCTEPQNEQHARIGRRQIQRRQGGLPHIIAHSGLFVGVQSILVFFHPGVLTAVNAVGDGVLGAVQRGSAQGTGGFFVGRTGPLHRLFHPRCTYIREGREQQAQQGQPPVVHQQHDHITHQRHAGIKNLGGELAHSFHAVVHV